MKLGLFEGLCVVVLCFALAAMARRRPAKELLIDYAALAVAGYLGEESCVALYDYYHYAAGWHLRLDRVPILVPMIWPLVILSAGDVAASLWPKVVRLRPLLVFAIVAFDASLVEVIAVRAGLWSWVEPGHLGVPPIGILGWGYFAIGAQIALSGKKGGPARAATIIALGPLFAHALILLTWWSLFRWVWRKDLGTPSLVALIAIGILILGFVLQARRKEAKIPLSVALPRMIAAGLFFGLLVTTAPSDAALWLHTAVVAIPYLAATEMRSTKENIGRQPRPQP